MPTPTPTKEASATNSKLQVLVAEDDPINVKVLRKRLEKAGYKVTHALNGEDCAAVYEEKPMVFDVVLMDMQMPIVDGLTSTKMIRAFEAKSDRNGDQQLSKIASDHGRVPIFAVSASLVEHEKDTYVDAGFDGWILKPIDFKRLETLLQGITDDKVRNDALYVPGQWERGGWFRKKGQGHMGQEQQAHHQQQQQQREQEKEKKSATGDGGGDWGWPNATRKGEEKYA